MRMLFAVLLFIISAGLVVATPQFPHVTPEEASSLGLRITDEGGATIGVDPEDVNSYQKFVCLEDKESPYVEIILMANHYHGNYAEINFRGYYNDFTNDSRTDLHDREYTGYDGSARSVHYRLSKGENYFVVYRIEEVNYDDGYHKDYAMYSIDYYILVGDYLLTPGVKWDTLTNAPPCNVEAILPKLINLYLSKFEGNTVRVPENVSIGGSGETSSGNDNISESSGGFLSPSARERMKTTTARIASLGGTITIQTPNGKLVKLSSGRASTALGWKAKYYGNKALDSLIDGASSLLPSPLGLFKDYVKGYKDSLVFNESESVRKTAKDLHVDGKSASLYNKMNSIEAREKALSPYKNAVPTSIATKPIETVLSSMGLAIKKTLAQDYEWEFRKTAEAAVRYRRMGLKYSEVIRNTVDEVMETTQGMNRVHMLNRNSGGEYSDQEARIRFYINQLFREGKL